MASLSSCATILLFLQIAVAVVVSGFPHNPRGKECPTLHMDPCYAAVEGPQERPSQVCCTIFKFIEDEECICQAIVGDRLLGDSKNLDKALRLPEKCELPAPRGPRCERRRSSDPFLQLKTGNQWLKPCYRAVEERKQPSDECCAKLWAVPSFKRCKSIRDDSYLGQQRYREEASRLPEKCGFPRCDLERRMAF